MNKLRFQITCFAVVLLALLAAFPAAAQCNNGREGVLSDTFLGASAVEWRMLVEHRAVTLTVSAPCGLVIDRTYEEGKSPFFSLKEIPADPDGVYTWQLRVAPYVDPEVEKMLMSARESGDDQTIEYELRQKGLLPAGPFLQTGSFTVVNGGIVPPGEEERQSSKLIAGVRPAASADDCPFDEAAPAVQTARLGSIAPAVDRGGSTRPLAMAAADTPRRITGEDVVYNDDLIVQRSLCVGFDCVNGESFSFDTIRLKENNLRIKFEDTSGGSFPSRDWEIEVNSSANGGQSHFRINDVDGARSPFTIEAAAPSHSLYVDSSGRIGRKTANPVLELHIADGDTPAIRLEQDTSSGFGAQVWDIAGNETNFFVRDVTGGSRLPFRIRPGAPTSSIDISNDGDVGVGTTSPEASLDIVRSEVAATQQTTSFSDTAANAPQFILRRADGTSAAPGAIDIADNLGLISFRGHNGTGFSGSRALITAQATESWSGAANGTKLIFSTTANGSTSPTVRFEIRENGDIFAGGAVVHSSSRELKENFAATDPESILRRVAELPIGTWNYKKDEPSLRHLGPTAEDFAAAFGLGNDDRTIAVNDSVGVALAAIQGLYKQLTAQHEEMARKLAERDLKIADLQRKLDELGEALPR